MSSPPHRPTQRVIDLLQLVSREGAKAYTLTEMAVELDVPKGTLFPILRTLKDSRFLHCNEQTGRYSIGAGMYETGMRYVQNGGAYGEILKIMQNIVNECLESCNYAELSGGDVLCLMKVDSPETIRMFSAPGRRLPAYSTALGKVLLSELTREKIAALYPAGMPPVTPHTITDLDRLMAQLAEVRRCGIATEQEENAEMIRCFAVPVRFGGVIAAALSVAIPVFRCTDSKLARIQGLLMTAQPRIEAVLENHGAVM